MNFISLYFIPFLIFIIGIIGILYNRRNLLLIIICAELILLAVNFSFLLTSYYLDDVLGQVFAIFVLTVAAAESSIGLAILVTYYRAKGTIAVESVKLLNG